MVQGSLGNLITSNTLNIRPALCPAGSFFFWVPARLYTREIWAKPEIENLCSCLWSFLVMKSKLTVQKKKEFRIKNHPAGNVYNVTVEHMPDNWAGQLAEFSQSQKLFADPRVCQNYSHREIINVFSQVWETFNIKINLTIYIFNTFFSSLSFNLSLKGRR